uniref:Conotoxin SIVC n=1 Tax=Conus striatus TaxID=6493 RepID=CA4C_CONST|nr:RecName: Full=Conotoxin SIVC; AltName: Full=KappaA-conotoxin SIVC; AltName: Full=STR18 [Conus striatus]
APALVVTATTNCCGYTGPACHPCLCTQTC